MDTLYRQIFQLHAYYFVSGFLSSQNIRNATQETRITLTPRETLKCSKTLQASNRSATFDRLHSWHKQAFRRK